jgi:hypothetical protein
VSLSNDQQDYLTNAVTAVQVLHSIGTRAQQVWNAKINQTDSNWQPAMMAVSGCFKSELDKVLRESINPQLPEHLQVSSWDMSFRSLEYFRLSWHSKMPMMLS